jgi:hypothetical protein
MTISQVKFLVDIINFIKILFCLMKFDEICFDETLKLFLNLKGSDTALNEIVSVCVFIFIF